MRFAISIATAAVTATLTLPAAAQQGPCFYGQPNYQGPPMCAIAVARSPHERGEIRDQAIS